MEILAYNPNSGWENKSHEIPVSVDGTVNIWGIIHVAEKIPWRSPLLLLPYVAAYRSMRGDHCINNLVRGAKSSPERRRIDYWCSERPSIPCRHPLDLRECESKVIYHTPFRPHLFEDRWPWGGFRRGSNRYGQNDDRRTGRNFELGNLVHVNRRFSDTCL